MVKMDIKTYFKWEKNKIQLDVNYIICPDMKCKGFYEKILLCTKNCPKKDEGYKVIHCSEGHPNKLNLEHSILSRVDCFNCDEPIFNLMSKKFQRIKKEDYE